MIAIILALLFGIVTICQVYLQKDIYPVSKLWIGSDYYCFYNSSQFLMQGHSPYKVGWYSDTIPAHFKQSFIFYPKDKAYSWYAFPPIIAYLNSPFTYFDIETASRLMFFLLIGAIFLAYALINRSFENICSTDKNRILLCGIIIIVLSYPFYFLIVRGHPVGIVIILLAMGIYLFKRDNPVCSVCFGLAISMMVFPVLLCVPLLLFRRYKYSFYTLLVIVILVLLAPDLWWEYFNKYFFGRIQEKYFMMEQNCSLANTCAFLMIFVDNIFSMVGLPKFRPMYFFELSLIISAIMFFIMAIADMKIYKKFRYLDRETEITLMMMYFPLMIAVPKNTFQYCLVLLILLVPALCMLALKFKDSLPHSILWLFIGGIALSQIQAHSLQQLFNSSNNFFHFFPAFGLFLVLIGCVTCKLWLWMKYTEAI